MRLKMRVLTFVVVAIVGFVVGGSVTSATAAHELNVKLKVTKLVTQLHQEPITWIGPDGQSYTTERWYEWTATFRWSKLPEGSSAYLRIANPATTDALAVIDPGGLRSYTFSGTSANGFWGFPSSSLLLSLYGCTPDSTSCFDASATVQMPD
jgi:hypothetical protein